MSAIKTNYDLVIKKNVSLKRYCTFHIGGKTKYLIEVNSIADLLNACKFCNSLNIKYKIIGFGSNLLFDDLGYNGAIIVNRSHKIRFSKNYCFVDSGLPLSILIKKAHDKNLSGLEALTGIPSTLGGAIVNNAGSFNTEIADLIEYVECYKQDDLNKKLRLNKDECKFLYRSSIFKSNKYIITRAKLKLNVDDYLKIAERINYFSYKKFSTQPINKYSAGSVFKKTLISPASKLIDSLGLKGLSVGDASVSSMHAGFIINQKSAKAGDVKRLIDIIKDKIYKEYNIDLETEIEFVDF